jgi:hypothetical protein
MERNKIMWYLKIVLVGYAMIIHSIDLHSQGKIPPATKPVNKSKTFSITDQREKTAWHSYQKLIIKMNHLWMPQSTKRNFTHMPLNQSLMIKIKFLQSQYTGQ